MNTAAIKCNMNWFSLSYGIVETSLKILCLVLISTFSEHVAALGAEKVFNMTLMVGENYLQ